MMLRGHHHQAHRLSKMVLNLYNVLTSVDTDITPLLIHPDRQRSRKHLESCLREINYLMAPHVIPSDQNANQDWQQFPPPIQKSPQPPQPPQQSDLMDVGAHSSFETTSYVPVDSESSRQQTEDEELPRKLPRKVDLPAQFVVQSETGAFSSPRKAEAAWDFTPRPPLDAENKSTILERQAQPRHSAQNLFETNFPGETRIFQQIHTLRSHLSPVRSLIACNSAVTLPDETCFVSAGDDSTVKFWRVSRVGTTTKRKGNFDVLPQITFRGHTGTVTCLAESLGTIWSGGSDGGIRGWRAPSATRDAYGSSGATQVNLTYGSRCFCGVSVGWTYELHLESCGAWDTTTITGICGGGWNCQDLGYEVTFAITFTCVLQI